LTLLEEKAHAGPWWNRSRMRGRREPEQRRSGST
jgi:hypothetical protein